MEGFLSVLPFKTNILVRLIHKKTFALFFPVFDFLFCLVDRRRLDGRAGEENDM